MRAAFSSQPSNHGESYSHTIRESSRWDYPASNDTYAGGVAAKYPGFSSSNGEGEGGVPFLLPDSRCARHGGLACSGPAAMAGGCAMCGAFSMAIEHFLQDR